MNIIDNLKNFLIKYSYHKYDTGSTEVQIIFLNFKIIKLKEHLKFNPKDIHGKTSYLKILDKKKKLIKYLKKKKNYNSLLIDFN